MVFKRIAARFKQAKFGLLTKQERKLAKRYLGKSFWPRSRDSREMILYNVREKITKDYRDNLHFEAWKQLGHGFSTGDLDTKRVVSAKGLTEEFKPRSPQEMHAITNRLKFLLRPENLAESKKLFGEFENLGKRLEEVSRLGGVSDNVSMIDFAGLPREKMQQVLERRRVIVDAVKSGYDADFIKRLLARKLVSTRKDWFEIKRKLAIKTQHPRLLYTVFDAKRLPEITKNGSLNAFQPKVAGVHGVYVFAAPRLAQRFPSKENLQVVGWKETLARGQERRFWAWKEGVSGGYFKPTRALAHDYATNWEFFHKPWPREQAIGVIDFDRLRAFARKTGREVRFVPDPELESREKRGTRAFIIVDQLGKPIDVPLNALKIARSRNVMDPHLHSAFTRAALPAFRTERGLQSHEWYLEREKKMNKKAARRLNRETDQAVISAFARFEGDRLIREIAREERLKQAARKKKA